MISDMLETANLFENKPNEVYGRHEDTPYTTSSIMIKRFSKKR